MIWISSILEKHLGEKYEMREKSHGGAQLNGMAA